jgi:hypothetical protein
MQRYKHVKDWCMLFDSDSTELAEETAMNLSAILPTSVATMPHGQNPDGSVRETNDANDDVDTALLAVDNRKKSHPDRLRTVRVYPPIDQPVFVSEQ